jgi:hypothetical protein
MHPLSFPDLRKDVKGASIEKKILFFFLFVFFFFSSPVLAAKGQGGIDKDSKISSDEKHPPFVGNFLVPTSQRPGPLIGFGLNFIGENRVQTYAHGETTRGTNRTQEAVGGSVAYGITDDLAIYLSPPSAEGVRDRDQKTTGWSNIGLQVNYALYTGSTTSFEEIISLAGAVSPPTASTNSGLLQGGKNTRVLLGGVFARMYPEWYGFTSQGVLLGSRLGQVGVGHEFLSQFGLGKNILTLKSGWIFAVLMEVDGQFIRKSQINGQTAPDSGGNIITVAPSLWISSETWVFQIGGGGYLVQELNGAQDKNNYFLIANIGIAF